MTTVEKPAGLDDTMDGIGLVAGAANVIMQLSWPGVGYGVFESRVESGRLFAHPIKRTRTTLTYLAVAARGTDDEKRLFRNSVNKAHAQVRSTAASPVKYNAFDHELQLWVAACIYRGFEDVHRTLHGPIPEHAVEYFYQRGATFGTTLQVPQSKWPKDRDAFEDFWNEGLGKVRIDPLIREHLLSIARMEFLPQPFPFLFGRLNLFFTTGYLPQRFRDEMLLAWTPRDQRRFERLMKTIGKVNRRLPVAVRELPYRALLTDLRWRIRTGRALT